MHASWQRYLCNVLRFSCLGGLVDRPSRAFYYKLLFHKRHLVCRAQPAVLAVLPLAGKF